MHCSLGNLIGCPRVSFQSIPAFQKICFHLASELFLQLLLKVETLVAPTSSELSSTTCLFTVLDGLATLMSAGSVACHWADILSPLSFLASLDLSHDYVGHGWTPGINWYFLVFLLLPYLLPNLNARCIGYPAHCYVFSTQNRIWFIVNAQ